MSKRVGRYDDSVPDTSLIVITNAMLASASQKPTMSARRRQPVDHGSVHSQSNMLETIQAMARHERLLSTAQVATFLNVSKLTIYRLIERRLLPVHRIACRLRFSHRDIAKYVESVRHQHQYGNEKN